MDKQLPPLGTPPVGPPKGTPVSGGPPAGPPAPEDGGPKRGSRRPLILAVVGLVLLLAVIGAGTVIFLGDRQDLESRLADSRQAAAKNADRLGKQKSKTSELSGELESAKEKQEDLKAELAAAKAKARAAEADLKSSRSQASTGGTGDWIAQYGSYRSRAGADQAAVDFNAEGFPATVLRSDHYPGLTPGYWVVEVGPTDRATAQGHVDRALDAGHDALLRNLYR